MCQKLFKALSGINLGNSHDNPMMEMLSRGSILRDNDTGTQNTPSARSYSWEVLKPEISQLL